MRSNGNKARLVFSNEEGGLHINVAVRWQKMDSREVDEQRIIVAKNRAGEEVRFKTVVVGEADTTPIRASDENFLGEGVNAFGQKKMWLTAEGAIVDSSEVTHFQVHADGTETPVEKFSKSDELEIIALKPMTDMEAWKIEDCYTIWADEVKEKGKIRRDEHSLYRLAKFLTEQGVYAVVKFSAGNSFSQSYGFIYPHYEDHKFALKMKSARAKIQWGENARGLMEIVEKVPVAQEDPKKAKSALAEL
jgi:hypothetical protein